MLNPQPQYTPPTEEDRRVFDALIPADHYLRRVAMAVDFERFRSAMAACYSPKMGRPAKEPVLLLKLEFLQFHDRLSDVRVIAQAQANAAELIRQEEETQHNDVEAFSADAVLFQGEKLRELTDPEGLNLEVFVPPVQPAATEYFTPDDFQLDEAGETLTCPAGLSCFLTSAARSVPPARSV